MCQNFVNLAKQQATIALEVDDVKDIYEAELQSKNQEITKLHNQL